MTLRVERFSGKGLEKYVDELARLRIEVFREFPYLYEGTLDYEQKYIRTYIGVPDSVIVIAFDGERVIGASTGLPLEAETDEVKKPFLDHSYDPKKCLSAWMSCLRPGGVCVLEYGHDPLDVNELDPFGANLVLMPYLIALWGRGRFGLRELLDAPATKPGSTPRVFLVLQRYEG